MPSGEENLVSVGTFPTQKEAEEYQLVVLAMGLACTVIALPDPEEGFAILAEPAHAEAISREFAAYAGEQWRGQETPAEPPKTGIGLEFALLWIISLLAARHFQITDPEFTERFCNSTSGLFSHGEWWRPFTALFLHADMDHLLGNAIFSLAFFPFVTHALGPRTGSLLILLSGTAGNVLNCWAHLPADYFSLGASTATFGALGILGGLSTFAAWDSRTSRRPIRLIVPIGAAIALLGWLGSGEFPTDVQGHLLGFLAGAVAGWITAAVRRRKAHFGPVVTRTLS